MLHTTDFKEVPLYKRGKVRDVYDLGDRLLIVATDRISCFDVVLPTPIPEKGRILTQVSLFWFSFLSPVVSNHVISANTADLPAALKVRAHILDSRFMITKKCEVIPFECVVRGYLSGSGWKEYRSSGKVCGISLPKGLRESERLPEPIFTPATKADVGHDENVDFASMANRIGTERAETIRRISVELYTRAARYAETKGIIIADTKFEFGLDQNTLILIDEVLTPDSSRFWPKDRYSVGANPPSFDKQFVRDWLESTGWDKVPPAPQLPDEVVEKTREKYEQALVMLTGRARD